MGENTTSALRAPVGGYASFLLIARHSTRKRGSALARRIKQKGN